MWLTGRGRKEWTRLVPELMAAGILTKCDRMLLALLCQRFADYLDARDIVAEEGLLIETTNGNCIQHPAIGIMNQAWRDVVKVAANFGLSPADRASITPAQPAKMPEAKNKFFS